MTLTLMHLPFWPHALLSAIAGTLGSSIHPQKGYITECPIKQGGIPHVGQSLTWDLRDLGPGYSETR